jgi:hypothetical protein
MLIVYLVNPRNPNKKTSNLGLLLPLKQLFLVNLWLQVASHLRNLSGLKLSKDLEKSTKLLAHYDAAGAPNMVPYGD